MEALQLTTTELPPRAMPGDIQKATLDEVVEAVERAEPDSNARAILEAAKELVQTEDAYSTGRETILIGVTDLLNPKIYEEVQDKGISNGIPPKHKPAIYRSTARAELELKELDRLSAIVSEPTAQDLKQYARSRGKHDGMRIFHANVGGYRTHRLSVHANVREGSLDLSSYEMLLDEGIVEGMAAEASARFAALSGSVMIHIRGKGYRQDDGADYRQEAHGLDAYFIVSIGTAEEREGRMYRGVESYVVPVQSENPFRGRGEKNPETPVLMLNPKAQPVSRTTPTGELLWAA